MTLSSPGPQALTSVAEVVSKESPLGVLSSCFLSKLVGFSIWVLSRDWLWVVMGSHGCLDIEVPVRVTKPTDRLQRRCVWCS